MIAAEEYFTKQSMIDVKELKESHPDFALVLDVNDDNVPDTSDLEHRRVPVREVEVGSYILVGAGEVCHRELPSNVNMVCQMTMQTLILRLLIAVDDKKKVSHELFKTRVQSSYTLTHVIPTQ